MNCQEFRTYLHGYVDGELDVRATLAGDAHIVHCDACAGAVAGERQFRHLLARQPRETAPPEFRARIITLCREEERRRRRRWVALPALAAAVLILAVALPLLTPRQDTALVGSLVDKHITYSQIEDPAELVSADRGEVAAWFRERVGMQITVPDYSAAGIHLVGARISEVGARTAAYVLYRKGQVLMSVFTVAGPDGPRSLGGTATTYRGQPYSQQEYKGYRTVSWVEGDAVFGLVSMLDYTALLECADSLRTERARARGVRL
jgi:anti-sigma factor RsiW